MDTIHLMMMIIIISCLFHILHFTVKAQQPPLLFQTSCNAAANYTSGSIYGHNLNQTLASLSANATRSGFATAVSGQETGSVAYGLIQCYAYSTRDECEACARDAAVQITRQCRDNKEGSILYTSCGLRYSDKSFFSAYDPTQFQSMGYGPQKVPDPDRFSVLLDDLLSNISSTAASSPSRVDLQSTPYNNVTDLYAMMQCAPTLDVRSCSNCLGQISGSYIPAECREKVGCRILSTSCNLRFELYQFALVYNYSLPFTAPPPPSRIGTNSTDSGSATNSPTGKKRSTKTVIIAAASSAAVVAIICALLSCFILRKYTKKADCDDNSEPSNNDSLMIDLSTLKAATNNFSGEYKLGEGGFGSVYKGSLLDGQEIAVKRLSRNSGQGLEELRTEVILVARLLHRNLVKLVGFCLEKEEKLLVYEYLLNGSLDKILFNDNTRSSLEWKTRFKIIVGIARGLLYLHEDSQLQVIHRDLKASNILLDEHMNPKISDFGLAKLFRGSQTQGNTIRIAGTYGYMAPEYARRGHFSAKSDVYSFGILVLEIVTGRKNSSFPISMNLQSHTWHHWANGTTLELMDPTLGDEWSRSEVLKCIQIGLLCVQDGAANRPTMSEAMMMLISSNTITSSSPGRPAFCTLPQAGTDQNLETLSAQGSINEVTITELFPR